MKLALYHPWIYLRGGIERSILQLVNHSRHSWTIYTGRYDRDHTFSEFRSLDIRELNRTSVDRSYAGVLGSSIQVLRQKLPLDDNTDAIVVWCDGIGDLIVFRNKSLPLFNICSTPLRAAFDPVYERLALRQRGLAERVAYMVLKHGFRAIDRLAWRNYTGVICTSTEVKNRIVQGGLCSDQRRMAMAYPGIKWNPDTSGAEYQPFILLAGRIMWTKNVQQAIRAFLRAALPPPWRLVIAGFVDGKSAEYLSQMQMLAGSNEWIEFVISPTDRQLIELYRTAVFCLFTPLNEDWGIVALEAMAAGKAVIALARGGPKESVVDGQTGILLDRDDDEQWANAIRKLCLTPGLAREMGINAHRHASRYTEEQFARTVDDAVERWMTIYRSKGRASNIQCPSERSLKRSLQGPATENLPKLSHD
ncbi:MAG: glycosyltransferase family 4 protein [Rhizomicrobium sp.]